LDVLTIGMDAGDGPLVRPPPFDPTFYNLQGRAIGFVGVQAPTVALSGSLYIPNSWNTSNLTNTLLNRRSEVLLQLMPVASDDCPAGVDCIYYGAIGFSNAQIADQLATGGPPRIRILKKGINDGWINLTTPFLSDAWNDFCVVYSNAQLEYFLNGNSVFVDTSLTPPDVGAGLPVRVRNFTVESYNFGTSYDAQWADLEYGPRASLSLSRSSSAALAPVGSTISITSTVTNTGTSNAANVQVIEPAVPGLTLSSVSGACSSLPCNLGALAAGQVRSYTSTYTLGSTATSFTSIASVRADSVDCSKADNTASITLGIGNPVRAPMLNITGMLLLMLALIAIARRGMAER
jgi:uncharacterized repeat protein (TIGR01451 family)